MKRHRNLERWGWLLPCFVTFCVSPQADAAPAEDEGGFSFSDESEDAPEGEGGFDFADESEGEEDAPEGEGGFDFSDASEDAPQGEEGEFIMQPVDEGEAGDEADEFVMQPVDEGEAGDPEDGELSEDSGFVFEDISEDEEALAEVLQGDQKLYEGDDPAGTVTGRVANASGEPLPAVYVRAEGTEYYAKTDINGVYNLRLPVGSYKLRVELDLYKSVEYDAVSVAADASTTQDAELVPLAGVIETFEVADDLNMEAEGALQEARKQSTQVSDGIDATEISKSGGGKASSVAVRIVGATVVDRRYLFVRGLGHRYGNTLLDGARVPSPEPEIRTVPLDMIPSSALSAIDVQKTFSPDVPGDFTGGSTRFVTREAPEDPTLTVGASLGANTMTSFREGTFGPSYGAADFFGVGNFPRGVPASFPNEPVGRGAVDENFQPRWTEEEIEAQGEALDTRTKLTRRAAPGNFGLKLSGGDSWSFNDQGGKFGILFAGGYSNAWQTNRETIGQYGGVSDVDENGDPIFVPQIDTPKVALESLKTTHQVSYNSLLKLQLHANSNHRFSLTGLYTREARDEIRDMVGTARGVAGAQELNYTRQRYTMRSIAFTQLRGSHKLQRANNLLIEYFGSFSQARDDEPAMREMVFLYNPNEDYYRIDNSLGPTGNQLYLDLIDNNENAALDITYPFRQWKGLDSKVKAGVWIDAKQRNFGARRYAFNYATGLEGDIPIGTDNPINDDTIGGGVSATNGGTAPFMLIDNLREQDSYRAWSRNVSGYLMLDLPFVSWFKVTGGARVESNVIDVTPYNLYAPEEVSDLGGARLQETDWLPAASLIFSPALPEGKGDMNIRLGGSRTLARPEFRELAPFQFRDYVGGFSKQGFPDLVSTKIWNADLRLEWFPRTAEVLAISAFFKQFTNPIEQVIGGSDNPTASWANVAGALNGGVELEVRKALDFLAPKDKKKARKALRDLSIGANFAYIYSRVELGTPCYNPDVYDSAPAWLPEAVAVEGCRDEYQISTSRSRPLQGQSPWIANAYIDYDNDDIGTAVRVLYNAFGPYIAQVQGFGLPDVYRAPMHMLDLTFSQRLLSYQTNDWGDRRNQLLLNIEMENLLNAVELETLANDRNGPIFQREADGLTFKIGLTYKL